ncbi:MAG: uroporphyrinogen-III C-methyltransferase [Archaeoglobaceae archaeon]
MGKVYIVGAGPGSVGLLTLRAYELIMKADVILHDELIGEVAELLKKSRAKLINVGKRRGRHRMSQEEINELLVKMAEEHETVVRLKGGDPFVFGRGGEEMEFLASRGVEFEVVPGVSSAIAVPAAACIPVTHRRYDPALVIITGTEARERLNWEALAKLNATIVVLMGVQNLRKICENLLKHGKDPETPVAVIEKGFSEHQRVVEGKLSDIAEVAEREKVEPPAVVVIGRVVKLRRLC